MRWLPQLFLGADGRWMVRKLADYFIPRSRTTSADPTSLLCAGAGVLSPVIPAHRQEAIS
jgi:hypothetical protein